MDKILDFLKKPLIKHLLLGLASFIVLIIIISYVLRFYTRHGEAYELANFEGMTLEQIENSGDASMFEIIVIDSVFVPNKPKGSVHTQDPPAGSLVKSGRKVYVSTVAFGMPKVVMPDLSDLSLRQATNTLENIGLAVGDVIYKPSKFHNVVYEQIYKGRPIFPGTEIDQGSAIILVVGREGYVDETETTNEN
ncbi:MAG: PASTA domain-containing protein [Bacteroidales bacterium]|nr:PASTA domain-containing protein [Bacteroidales bacterium]MDY0215719.1 PASTA domain-containing protein [Bacteroidales bacterium]